ncbi:MAG: histidine phosphatase family protein [Leptospirillia bacterium]
MFLDPPHEGRFRLFLMRHGHLENSDHGAINGQGDVSLSQRGQEQMASRARFLREVPATLLLSSTLRRTRQSLAPFTESRPHLSPQALEGFRERSFGFWEGKTREEIAALDPTGYARWQDLDVSFAPAGGESLLSFRDRVLGALRDFLSHAGYRHNALCVAHSGVNRILLLDALGHDLSGYFRLTQGYGSLNIIDYTEGGDPVVLLMNLPCDLPPMPPGDGGAGLEKGPDRQSRTAASPPSSSHSPSSSPTAP